MEFLSIALTIFMSGLWVDVEIVNHFNGFNNQLITN
jgi:hypothetical protein